MNFDTDNLTTVKDFIRWGASRFSEAKLSFGHGLSSPLDEAVYLVLNALHLPVDTSPNYWDGHLTAAEIITVKDILVRRIKERKPAAYLTNEGWFAGLSFFVDERVLVPRSPIAELVESQLTPWVDPDEVGSILDLCTGSGCIGIACAYAFTQANVDLADISQDAIDVATINIQRHDAAQQVQAIQSNLFESLKGKQYDIIVSNPPYVDAEDMLALTEEFKHEPELGLSSGENGLDLTISILEQAADYLTENGILVVEVGNSQYALQQQYPDTPFQWLEFERGGDGVFLIDKYQLKKFFSK
ncbi:MAG: 50S ribosomal protein L3 N(5)-glutamine methyltransferase [Aquificaceae bacterium]|nr:MAG: 50S ribosomal protein L3 N(5)-glutamine methyltransferase [Aquificaceae bacterium]